MSKHWVTELDQSIPLKIGAKGFTASKPIRLVDYFKTQVSKRPDAEVLHVERDGKWVNYTWREYSDLTTRFAKSLIKLDMPAKTPNAILGFNSPEWFVVAMGSAMAGGILTGIYNTNGPEACQYVIDHSGSFLVAVDTQAQLAKILKVRDQLPSVKAIVIWLEDKPADAPDDVYTFAEFLDIGKDVSQDQVEARIAAQEPQDCVSLIYTSGTTGPPKAVMLSQDNVTWTATRVGFDLFKAGPEDHVVSYLPLSHIAAQMVDLVMSAVSGFNVWFARPDALKGSLLETLKTVRPTLFITVPRVWVKMQEGMKAKAASGGLMKVVSDWAKAKGTAGGIALQQGQELPWGWWLAEKIFMKVKTALGLDRCRIGGSAAAPISRDTLEYFMSLNIIIYEIYGMSESTGPETVSHPGKWRLGSAGSAFPGAEIKIDNPVNGEGEICFRGRHVFMGYLKNPKATAETIDEDGWLHSGDVGRLDDDGFLYITGRIKELIITEGGENIPPVLIEEALKKELPAVSNIMVIGDKRKYLTMLVTLKATPNLKAAEGEYEFFEDLLPAAKASLAAAGFTGSTVAEAAASDEVRAYIQKGLDVVNERATSRAQRVQKFTLLPRDFTLSGGELTPTLKLKRKIAAKNFAAEIEALYA